MSRRSGSGARPSNGVDPRQARGRAGESLAAAELERRGYRIVARNVRVGRREIDIIARRGATVVFCEVRSRSTTEFGHPAETVDAAKRQRLREAATQWLRDHGGGHARFDVVAIVWREEGGASLEYYEGCF